MLRLAKLASPTPEELLLRNGAMLRITSALAGVASIQLFGSSGTGLLLPDSDLDVAATIRGSNALSKEDMLRTLHEFRLYLLTAGAALASHPAVVRTARVPILRFTESISMLSVDLSIRASKADGVHKTLWTLRQLDEKPLLRYLVLMLKGYFRQRGVLGGPGGISSHLVFLMAVASYPEHTSHNLGQLLVAFFQRHSQGQLGLPCHLEHMHTSGDFSCLSRVRPMLTSSLQQLQSHPCLSTLLEGWPADALITTRDELKALLRPNISAGPLTIATTNSTSCDDGPSGTPPAPTSEHVAKWVTERKKNYPDVRVCAVSALVAEAHQESVRPRAKEQHVQAGLMSAGEVDTAEAQLGVLKRRAAAGKLTGKEGRDMDELECKLAAYREDQRRVIEHWCCLADAIKPALGKRSLSEHQKETLRARISTFERQSASAELLLPSLTSSERHFVHKLAEQGGLGHSSHGKGRDRTLRLTKVMRGRMDGDVYTTLNS